MVTLKDLGEVCESFQNLLILAVDIEWNTHQVQCFHWKFDPG